MMSAILSNGVNTIIIESMDRLARELRVQETLLVYLASKGVELYSARTEENITRAIQADPMKKALIQIQGVFAELEKSQLVLRLRKGRERARQDRGKCEGRKAFGETPDEKAIVRRVKALRRRKRNGKPGHTLQEIANRLNGEDIKTKTGKDWHPAQIQRLLQRPSK
jgi:site-specific DNA recombinase